MIFYTYLTLSSSAILVLLSLSSLFWTSLRSSSSSRRSFWPVSINLLFGAGAESVSSVSTRCWVWPSSLFSWQFWERRRVFSCSREYIYSAVCCKIAAFDSFSPSWCGRSVRKLAKPELMLCIRRLSLEFAISRRILFSCSIVLGSPEKLELESCARSLDLQQREG